MAVSFTIIQSVSATASTIKITRRIARVCGQDASAAACAAVRARSFDSRLANIVEVLAVESGDYSADSKLVSGRDTAKLNTKGVWSSVMDYFAAQ